MGRLAERAEISEIHPGNIERGGTSLPWLMPGT
jgi:hypothetical protein